MLLTSLTISAADDFWAMKTQTGEIVKLSDVNYILETDGAKTFSIVCTSGTVNDVTSVTFIKTTAAGVATPSVAKSGMIANQIGNELIIIGASSNTSVCIYSVSGAKEKEDRISNNETHIDVSGLASGVHVLKVGNNSVKFLKK